MAPLFPHRALFRGLELARFEHVLSQRTERERWERFVLHTANTPGRQRVVLRLKFTDRREGEWMLWAVYELLRESAVDTVRLALAEIYMSEPGEPAELPDDLVAEPVFEADT